MDIAARESTRARWPASDVCAEGGDVLIFSAEDDAGDTIRPRLEAAGADLSRIYVEAIGEVADAASPVRGFTLADVARLDEALAARPDVTMVGIDPISAYLGSVDSHKNADVRSLLAHLQAVAAKHKVAVVAVSHLSKSGDGAALLRVSGSLAFVAAARAAYVICEDSADPMRRLMLPLKNNLGADQTGYAFTVEPTRLPSGIETCRLRWEPAEISMSADEALTPPVTSGDASALDAARDFLLAELADGPKRAADLQAAAKEAGVAWASVRRAKKGTGAVSRKSDFGGGWMWELAPKARTESEDAQEPTVSILDRDEHLRPQAEDNESRGDGDAESSSGGEAAAPEPARGD